MKTINIKILSECNLLGQRVVALGLFESMHRGHTKLIKNTVKIASESKMKATVVTLSKPINKSGYPIFDIDHKLEVMEGLGVEEVIIIEMNDEVRHSSSQAFINMLKNIGTQIIISGEDYHFGYMGLGDVELLKTHFDTRVEAFELEAGTKVSTSLIKTHLSKGKIKHANKLLGYNYYIKGTVEQGKQLGRTIGVPTANVYPEISPLATGVYLTKTTVLGNHYRSITNIGYNPTTGDNRLSIETYIGDGFSSDIYGQEIKVEMFEKIRDEIKFGSLDELVARLNADIKYMEETNYENC